MSKPQGARKTPSLAGLWPVVTNTVPATLRTEHEAITDDMRRELLARSYAGEQIEIILDKVAYVQTPGVHNRNFVRFREERLAKMAATGVTTPFLRDHAQRDHAARGGTVIESRATPNGTAVEFQQSSRLTVPWAVQSALQGTVTAFSIGWNPLPPPGKYEPELTCSLCKAPVRLCLWDKGHWRGSAHGSQVVEWIIENAELIETSVVNVAAVREVRARAIEQASAQVPAELEAELHFFGLGPSLLRPATTTGPQAQEKKMDKSKLCSLLGLSPEASEAEIEAAIAASKQAAAEPAELARLKQTVETLTGKVDGLAQRVDDAMQSLLSKAQDAQAKAKAAEVQSLLEAAIQDGRLQADGPVYELMREALERDLESGKAKLAALPRVTPVGAPRQSAAAGAAGGREGLLDAQLRAKVEGDAAEMKVVKRANLPLDKYIELNRDELARQYGLA